MTASTFFILLLVPLGTIGLVWAGMSLLSKIRDRRLEEYGRRLAMADVKEQEADEAFYNAALAQLTEAIKDTKDTKDTKEVLKKVRKPKVAKKVKSTDAARKDQKKTKK